jgi:hypothetical protein
VRGARITMRPAGVRAGSGITHGFGGVSLDVVPNRDRADGFRWQETHTSARVCRALATRTSEFRVGIGREATEATATRGSHRRAEGVRTRGMNKTGARTSQAIETASVCVPSSGGVARCA